MSEPALLADISTLGLSASVRPAVDWWRRHGPRVTV
jgi:hypothetical protein